MKVRTREGMGDVVVRFNGRRMRVNEEWHEFREDALEKLIEEAGDKIELEGDSVDKPKASKKKKYEPEQMPERDSEGEG